MKSHLLKIDYQTKLIFVIWKISDSLDHLITLYLIEAVEAGRFSGVLTFSCVFPSIYGLCSFGNTQNSTFVDFPKAAELAVGLFVAMVEPKAMVVMLAALMAIELDVAVMLTYIRTKSFAMNHQPSDFYPLKLVFAELAVELFVAMLEPKALIVLLAASMEIELHAAANLAYIRSKFLATNHPSHQERLLDSRHLSFERFHQTTVEYLS